MPESPLLEIQGSMFIDHVPEKRDPAVVDAELGEKATRIGGNARPYDYNEGSGSANFARGPGSVKPEVSIATARAAIHPVK